MKRATTTVTEIAPTGEPEAAEDERASGTGPGKAAGAHGAAGLSVDVDSVAAHLEGHGFERAPDAGTVYRVAVPRALDMLDRHDVRATFFLIASEARKHRDVVREIVDRGHEIGSHSLTHSLPFGGKDGGGLDREVRGSRFVLQTLSGTRVHGFRPPVAAIPPGTRSAAMRAGYRYLAAAPPHGRRPLLRPRWWNRRARRLRSSGLRGLLPRWWSDDGRSETPRGEADGLTEIPVSSIPGLPFVYCHTTRLLAPDPLFRLLRKGFQKTCDLLTYQIHAVDFLGRQEDRLHPVIQCHPGMGLSLERKLELVEEELERLSSGRRVVGLQSLVAERLTVAAQTAIPTASRTRGLAVAPTRGTLHWT